MRERGGQKERGAGGMLRSDALHAEWTRPPRCAAAPAPWGWPGAPPMPEPGPQGWRRLRWTVDQTAPDWSIGLLVLPVSSAAVAGRPGVT